MPCLNKPDRATFLAECVAAAAARTRMYAATMTGPLLLPLPVDDVSYPDNVPCLPTYAQINQIRALYEALGALMYVAAGGDATCTGCAGTLIASPSWTGSRKAADNIGGLGIWRLDVTAAGTWRAGTGGAVGNLGSCDIVVDEHVDELTTYRATLTWWIRIDEAESWRVSVAGCGANCTLCVGAGGICQIQACYNVDIAGGNDCTTLAPTYSCGGVAATNLTVGWSYAFVCREWEDLPSFPGTWYHELCADVDAVGGPCDGDWKYSWQGCVEVLYARTNGNDYDDLTVCAWAGQVYLPAVTAQGDRWQVKWPSDAILAAADPYSQPVGTNLCAATCRGTCTGYAARGTICIDTGFDDEEGTCDVMFGHVEV